MQSNIDEVLAYEIKKEIADRYFGFRKLIEDDKLDLDQKIKLYSVILEKRICFDLIRLYILLKDEELIETFVRLSGLQEKLFYDPYITTSPTIRARMFKDVPQRGLTRAGRFKNLVQDCYAELVRNVELYREKIDELKESHAAINEEIELFYRRNDLSHIMQFLRSVGSADESSGLQGGLEVGLNESLEKKMRVSRPEPIESHLPIIPPLTPLAAIRKELKKLICSAYKKHQPRFQVST